MRGDNFKKTLHYLCLSAMVIPAYADVGFGVDQNVNDTYIHSQSYLQNPFVGQVSGGGTQNVNESAALGQTVVDRLFTDGTWNAYGVAGMLQNMNSPLNYALSGTLFGQTGSVAGFSFGGAFNLTNPVLTPQLNPSSTNSSSSPFFSSDQQYVPSEAYVEYQYSHILQADVGWIGINNSPFLAGNYYINQTSGFSYQGALLNINPGPGWLLTALGFNGVQTPSQNGFSGVTFYNPGSNFGMSTPYTFTEGSPGTVALGASYYTPDNNYNFRMWGYQFFNYANLVYADNTLKLPVSKDSYFTLAAQGGKEWGDSGNAITNAGLGNIDSNFVGAQIGYNYDWFGLSMGYNNVWGPYSAFGHGGIVSPYTYNENVDPLYTNSWMTGLVQKGTSGQAFIISPSFALLDKNLTIAPSFSVSQPTEALADQEYDLVTTYIVPQIKGLKLFSVFGYQTQTIVGNNQLGQAVQGGDNWTMWFIVNYLY